MAKVKYSKHNQEFMNELRTKVKEYLRENGNSRFGNINLIVKSLFMLTIYTLPYVLMISGMVTSFPGIILCWLIMGVGMAGVGMVIMHDANHGSYSDNSTLNNWLGKSLYLLGGFPPNWRYQHNTLHHGYTNIDGFDEDINPLEILRFSPHKPLRRVHKYQHIYALFLYGLMTLSWVTDKDFKQFLNYTKRGIKLSKNKNYKFLFADMFFSKIIYYSIFIAIPIIVIPIAWYWILILFLLMHFISGIILATIFQTAHVLTNSAYPVPDEQGNMENHWAIHQLYTTSDYAPKSGVFSWLIGGLNYQIEHHLFPNISHVHYQKISRLVKKTTEKYNLPYNVHESFFKALINHFSMLKKLGKV